MALYEKTVKPVIETGSPKTWGVRVHLGLEVQGLESFPPASVTPMAQPATALLHPLLLHFSSNPNHPWPPQSHDGGEKSQRCSSILTPDTHTRNHVIKLPVVLRLSHLGLQ